MKYFRNFALLFLICLILIPGCISYASEHTRNADEKGSTIEVAVTGDLMALAGQLRGARAKNGYDFSSVFKYVAPILQGADIAIGNLETPVAGPKYPYTTGSYKTDIHT